MLIYLTKITFLCTLPDLAYLCNMRAGSIYLFITLFLSGIALSQTRVAKPVKKSYPKKTNLSVGTGFTRSVLFLSRNVKENNDVTGNSFYVSYGGARLIRVSAECTFYRPIDIAPTWYNIKASSLEANVHFMARFQNSKAYFYPLLGLSYNHFQGFFTGRNDFMALSDRYAVNSTITTNWLGLNIGTGYEHYFGPFSVFADYKMRVGANDGKDHQINIMDVCFGLGARYNIRVPSVYKLFSGTKSRYFLDTDKE
jgi:hypothetical protein